MTAPSLRTTTPAGQAPLVPDRMSLIAEWDTPQGDRLELYADREAGDGMLIVVGPDFGPEPAATLTDLGQAVPAIAWRGTLAARSRYWHTAQAAIARARLAGHRPGGERTR